MAELKTLCLGNNCMENTLSKAGQFINVDNTGNISLKTHAIAHNLGSTTLSSGSMYMHWLFNVPKRGIFIGTVQVTFGANASGSRFAQIAVAMGGGAYDAKGGAVRTSAAPSGDTILSCPVCQWFDQNQEFSIRLFQNSGSNITVSSIWTIGYILEA